MVEFVDARRLALAQPGSREDTCYGTPAFYVGKKLFARLREDGSLVVKLPTLADRPPLLAEDPDVFWTTDHYRDYPSILVHLDVVTEARLVPLLEQAWRVVAPKRLIAARG
jgi:hypothetical protein